MDCTQKIYLNEMPAECSDFKPLPAEVKEELTGEGCYNHPSHYNREGRKECIDEIVDIFGWENAVIWATITAYRYDYRCGAKDAEALERKKQAWYVKWSLENVAPWMKRAEEAVIKYFKAVTK